MTERMSEQGRLKRIHVNQHIIRSNVKAEPENRLPPVGVERPGYRKVYGDTIEILDKAGEVVARFIYRPDKPLPCGARLWVETYAKLRVDGLEVD